MVWLKQLWTRFLSWKEDRRRKKKLEEMRKRDPFIYK